MTARPPFNPRSAHPPGGSDRRVASGGSARPPGRPKGAHPPGGSDRRVASGGSHPRRILGIDPGLRVTGFGLVDASGNRLAYVASGVVRTGTGDMPLRLGVIVRDLAHVIAEYSPCEVVVEQVFVNVNPTSTLALGQARGAAIAAAVLAGLPVHEYTAGQIKQAVVGGGRAAKSQVQAMVSRLLGLPGLPSPDAADALAAAVCHAHSTTGVGALSRGTPRVRGGRMMRIRAR
ncbi:Crossover junction endodeoxyribonuclease RuvC [Burkholderiales bacterium]|nr:Crossover junction endodeoxyribonuclease RuvC [Burkholderiales bacterium]